jgi:hypothetical protein
MTDKISEVYRDRLSKEIVINSSMLSNFISNRMIKDLGMYLTNKVLCIDI